VEGSHWQGIPDDESKPAPKSTPTAAIVPKVAPKQISNARQSFTLKENRDIYGHDIKLVEGEPGIPGTTVDECVDACNKRKACKAFSFDKWNGWCFLKNGIATSLIDPHSTIGVKKPQQLPNASKAAPEMNPLRGRRFRDKPIQQIKADSYEACRDKCAGGMRCVAFSYLKSQRSKQNCQLFNGSVGHYSDPTADSGYKAQNPP
jgi:hypothetical protein